MPAGQPSGLPEDLADAIAAEISAHPSVIRLNGGPHGLLATHLRGRKVLGVRVAAAGEPVQIGVVLRLGDPLVEIADALRRRVRTIAGDVPVDVHVGDVTEPTE